MVILSYLYVDMSNSSNSSGISNGALSVVNIVATNSTPNKVFQTRGNERVVGSGIIISEDGYIVTNLHIINGQKKLMLSLMMAK